MTAHRPSRTTASTENETPLTEAELFEAGRAHRKEFARSEHAHYSPAKHRDPLGILERQHAHLVADLVPLRLERMLRSPYDYFRGADAVQAADLAAETVTGRNAVINGNPHLGNFGIFATRDRTLVMDLGDFDDSAYGPWEWDLKRLVTSVVIAARDRGHSDDQAETAALETAASYRFGLRQFLELVPLDRYWLRADVRAAWPGKRPSSEKTLAHALRAAGKRAAKHELHTITEHTGERLVFVEQPPAFTHVDDATVERVSAVIDGYRTAAPPEIALLLADYRVSDVVRRIAGVGGVGVDRFLVALTGPADEPIVLQVRPAGPGVLREATGLESSTVHDGTDADRIVGGQRVLQALRDPFVAAVTVGNDHYTVRQFREGGIAFDLHEVDTRSFMDYTDACGTTLARAHAQSPAAPFIAGYLGSATTFDSAVASWALAYADQSLADFRELTEAVRSGRFTASSTEPKRTPVKRKRR